MLLPCSSGRGRGRFPSLGSLVSSSAVELESQNSLYSELDHFAIQLDLCMHSKHVYGLQGLARLNCINLRHMHVCCARRLMECCAADSSFLGAMVSLVRDLLPCSSEALCSVFETTRREMSTMQRSSRNQAIRASLTGYRMRSLIVPALCHPDPHTRLSSVLVLRDILRTDRSSSQWRRLLRSFRQA